MNEVFGILSIVQNHLSEIGFSTPDYRQFQHMNNIFAWSIRGEIALTHTAETEITDKIFLEHIHFTMIEQIEDRLEASIGRRSKSIEQSSHFLRLNTFVCALLLTEGIGELDR